LIARLSDSVAPDVQTISLPDAPISAPDLVARRLDGLLRVQPKLCDRLAALPNTCVKYGSIASSTRGSTGVVAWLSM
jgi:hypothetical protein